MDWLESNDENVLKMVEILQGPYSFIYFDIEKRCLWISRDVLGRHSLLWDVTDTFVFVCSVGHKSIEALSEVPAAGVFCFQFDGDSITSKFLRFYKAILIVDVTNELFYRCISISVVALETNLVGFASECAYLREHNQLFQLHDEMGHLYGKM